MLRTKLAELKEDPILNGLKKAFAINISDLIEKFLAGDMQAGVDLQNKLKNGQKGCLDALNNWEGIKKFYALKEIINSAHADLRLPVRFPPEYTARDICLYGMIYRFLREKPESYYSIAKPCFEEALKRGDVFANYLLGEYYSDDRDTVEKAMKYFEVAAKNKVVAAFCKLANLKRLAIVREKQEFTDQSILDLYMKGMEGGDPEAMRELCYCYDLGRLGLVKDREKAFNYLTQAAIRGCIDAITDLNYYEHVYKIGKLAQYCLFIASNYHGFKSSKDNYAGLIDLRKKNENDAILSQYIALGLLNHPYTQEKERKEFSEYLNKLRSEDPVAFYDNLTAFGYSFDAIEPLLSQEEKDHGSVVINALDKTTPFPSGVINIIFRYGNPSDKSLRLVREKEEKAEKETAEEIQKVKDELKALEVKLKGLEAAQEQAMSGERSFSLVKGAFQF